MAKKKQQPAMARKCWNGCGVSKRSAKYCTGCGERLGISFGEHTEHLGQRFAAAKAAADPLRGTYWGARADREADPGQRELMLKMAGAEAGAYAAGSLAYLAKAARTGPSWFGGAA